MAAIGESAADDWMARNIQKVARLWENNMRYYSNRNMQPAYTPQEWNIDIEDTPHVKRTRKARVAARNGHP